MTTEIIDELSDLDYHNDTASLSSSGARLLLETCPAQFRWVMDHPREDTKTFDEGHAAHALVLGEGQPLEAIPFDEWRTKEAKARVAEAREAGRIPLKPTQFAMVHDMAASILRHPRARQLFADGQAERSLYYRDEQTGVQLRARPDWLTTIRGLTICVDYKTSPTADPAEFVRSIAKYGYFMQDAWYRDAIRALGLHDDPAFLFVVQAKVAPYLVSVIELAPDDVELGRDMNRAAIDLFAQCVRENHWPAYGDSIHTVSLPAWYRKQHEGYTE